jgi:type IV pilus assembly protein PilW
VTDLSANKKVSTDVLVVRHAETCLPGETNCEADVAGKLYFQSSQSHFLPLPRPIPEPNCPAAGLTSDAVPYVLDTAGFNTLHKKNCSTVITEKRKFISNIYYIRDYASTEGDGIPTLMISQFDLVGGTLAHQEAVPLVEGIEGFNVELGVDSLSDNGTNIITNADASKLYTAAIIWDDPENLISPINRGDGRPDGAFIRCTDAVPCTPAQLTNTVVVKLYVLARADKVSPGYTDSKTYALGSTVLGPYNDGFKRHVFSTTVRLNNISSRRETP